MTVTPPRERPTELPRAGIYPPVAPPGVPRPCQPRYSSAQPISAAALHTGDWVAYGYDVWRLTAKPVFRTDNLITLHVETRDIFGEPHRRPVDVPADQVLARLNIIPASLR